jgi:hypothetical protein
MPIPAVDDLDWVIAQYADPAARAPKSRLTPTPHGVLFASKVTMITR